MERLFDGLARLALAGVQLLPLPLAVGLGRLAGRAAWWLAPGWRRRLLRQLTTAYGGEWMLSRIREVGRAQAARRGEEGAAALRTPALTAAELAPRTAVVGLAKLNRWLEDKDNPGILFAVGHFGNVALLPVAAGRIPWLKPATVAPPRLRPGERAWWDQLRHQYGLQVIPATRGFPALCSFIRNERPALFLFVDQPPAGRGMTVPFFGRPTPTPRLIATLARRLRMPIFPLICFHAAPGRWRLEIGDEIPTRCEDRPRPARHILRDVNAALEEAVRRDPPNWNWAAERWPSLPPS